MNNALDVREFSIVVIGKKHNPTILNPDFLKYNDILPANWELSRTPICVEPFAEVSFKNNITITAQPERVIFLENITGKNIKEIMIPKIANKYTQTLPHVEYKAVGINLRGHVILDNDKDASRKYLLNTLLAPGPWRNFGNKPVRASVKFEYVLDRSICNLTIEEKKLKESESEFRPVVIFASNFHHELRGETRKERAQDLHEIIRGWKTDLNSYKLLVKDIFLIGGIKDENKSD